MNLYTVTDGPSRELSVNDPVVGTTWWNEGTFGRTQMICHVIEGETFMTHTSEVSYTIHWKISKNSTNQTILSLILFPWSLRAVWICSASCSCFENTGEIPKIQRTEENTQLGPQEAKWTLLFPFFFLFKLDTNAPKAHPRHRGGKNRV